MRYKPIIAGLLGLTSAIVYAHASQEWMRLCAIAVFGLCNGWLVSRAEYAEKINERLDKVKTV